MNVGTKSLLFGVHQFIWHPITVTLAWHRLREAGPSHESTCRRVGLWILKQGSGTDKDYNKDVRGYPGRSGPQGIPWGHRCRPVAGMQLGVVVMARVGKFRMHSNKFHPDWSTEWVLVYPECPYFTDRHDLKESGETGRCTHPEAKGNFTFCSTGICGGICPFDIKKELHHG